jgi:hypothetical protein
MALAEALIEALGQSAAGHVANGQASPTSGAA